MERERKKTELKQNVQNEEENDTGKNIRNIINSFRKELIFVLLKYQRKI